jgi:hypothetical protein
VQGDNDLMMKLYQLQQLLKCLLARHQQDDGAKQSLPQPPQIFQSSIMLRWSLNPCRDNHIQCKHLQLTSIFLFKFEMFAY